MLESWESKKDLKTMRDKQIIMITIDYKKLSACIEDARRDFRRGDSDTAVIDPYKVTMLPLYKGAEFGWQ